MISTVNIQVPPRPAGTPNPAPGPSLSRLKALFDLRRGGILLPFIALFLVLSFTSGPFLTKANLLNIVDQQASTLIPAAAATLVLVAGGIDLSIGAVYGLAGVVAAQLRSPPTRCWRLWWGCWSVSGSGWSTGC